MVEISYDEAKQMRTDGWIFKPHNLYQSEVTARMVIFPTFKRPYQVTLPVKYHVL